MEKYKEIGKGGIVKEGIFNRFPFLVPATFGDNYWKNPKHRKLMIIMESNYFSDEFDDTFKDPETWYKKETTKPLISEKQKKFFSNYKSDYPPFNKLRDSMSNVLGTNIDAIFSEALFYNYFLRPATKAVSFRKFCNTIDQEVAATALYEILKIDKPDIVIFASKYAYDEFKKKKYDIDSQIKIDFVYHPSSRYQKWESNANCKQKFEKLLKDHWLIQ